MQLHLLIMWSPLEVIQNLMGHEKGETTRVYAYLSGRLRRELYKKLQLPPCTVILEPKVDIL